MTITDRSRRPGRSSPAACSSRRPGTTAANRVSGRRSPTAKKGSPITSCRSPTAANTACTTSTRACERAASTTTSRPSRSPGSCRASSGPPRPHPDPAASPHRQQHPPAQEAGTPGRHSGRHARSRYGQHPSSGATLVLRPAHRRQQKQGHGVSEKSPHFRLATPSPSPTSRPPETTRYTVSATSSRRNFSLPP
jgi:hypothetical protein